MPAPVAAPPSTPTPQTPKAPVTTPKSSPNPEPQKAPDNSDAFADAFADIDQLDGKKPQPKKEAVKPDPSQSGADDLESDTTGISQPEDSHAANADASSKEKQSVSTETKPVKAKELRDAYEGLKKKVKEEYEPKLKRITELESKLKEVESRDPNADKAVQEKYSTLEKRNQELEQSIRLTNYKQSKEYKEHEKTLTEAWASARDNLAGINITSRNAETQEVSERELTLTDIASYANLDPKQRLTKLKTDIPDPAERTMVINHINTILDKAKQLDAAEKKAAEDSEAHFKTQKEQQEQFQKNRAKFWQESNEFYAKQYPKWFGKSEDDKDGNVIFDKGIALADLAFAPQNLSDEQIALLPKSIQEMIASKKPFTPEQLTKLHSIIRNKSANHDRLAHQNKQLAARVAELEKSLKEYEKSEPDNVRTGVVNGKKSEIEDANAELDTLARTSGR